jgi:DNA polymerase III subunit epsilon
MTFTAIDFETAMDHHICAVGIVCVEGGEVVDEFSALIRPPGNQYSWFTIKVHGIQPHDTANAPSFPDLYPEIAKRLRGRVVVAHNEAFDRSVLKKTMADYGLDYSDLDLPEPWECTCRIFRAKGYRPANLAACCERLDIPLNHHEALSDARACAALYLTAMNQQQTIPCYHD